MSTMDKKTEENSKNVTEVPTGFIARKTVNRKLFQEFFGVSRFGGSRAKAKKAAEDFIESVNKLTAAEKVVRANNSRNVTGFIGVAWHCRKNTHRQGAVVHSFRAQVASKDKAGRPDTKAWSVQKHGLFGAYCKAAEWREKATGNDAPSMDQLQEKFLYFLDNYKDQMADDPDVRETMSEAIFNMYGDPEVPVDLVQKIRDKAKHAIPSSKKQRVKVSAIM